MFFNLFFDNTIPFNLKIIVILVYLLALTLTFVMHEFAHAFVAVKLGDNTPRLQGRLTLNPIAHFDVKGLIFLLLLGFGWGKPVVINTHNFDDQSPKGIKRGFIMVSLAGVTANFLLALISAIVLLFINPNMTIDTNHIANYILYMFFIILYQISMLLLGFNLIPVPPLDGFNVLDTLLPLKTRYSDGYRKYVEKAPTIFFIVILVGLVIRVNVIGLVIKIIDIPFEIIIKNICNIFRLFIHKHTLHFELLYIDNMCNISRLFIH